MDDKTLKNYFDTVFKNFKTTGDNQKTISGQIKQLDERIKKLELVIQTLVSTSEIVMNLYNQNKDKIDETLTSVLETMKSQPKQISETQT